MKHSEQLEFTRKLFESMKISTCIVEDYEKNIPNEIDLGLRTKLYNISDYKNYFSLSMGQASQNTIYRFFDEYYCTYVFMRLPQSNSFLFIGPYLRMAVDKSEVEKLFENRKMSLEHSDFLTKYYNKLPVLDDENIVFTIANTLGEILWESRENYNFEYVEYAINDKSKPIDFSPVYIDAEEPSLSLSILEENYADEKKFMDAVSQGKLNKLSTPVYLTYTNSADRMLTDSLRNRKNYLITLNVVLRLSAERGGVHPLHVDRMASLFAKKIEMIYSKEESRLLQSEMIRSYCLLVKEYSLKKYSYLIGQTLTLISYDLTDDLSLKSISKKLSVNPTYLSALFKKECGCTLTDYVNSKRIEHAIGLLKNSDKLVSTIAGECGVEDTNYFIRLFKKHTGITPNQYRMTYAKK